MEEKGYLLLVLNTHMPFVRNSVVEHSEEENWLFEAITECYIPLIEVLQRLIRDSVDFKITVSFTPCLIAMLTDSLLQKRYLRYIQDRILLAEREMERLKARPEFLRLAQMYHERFVRCREVFTKDWDQDLTSAFRYLRASGKLDVLASAATHAYFPLWELHQKVVDLQIQVGVQQYQDCFGERPLGFWLPECGYFPGCGCSPGVDTLLKKAGIRYFFLNARGILNGHPRPKFGVYAPIHCPSGVAAFGRDWESHDLVWLEDKGYPGDPFYLNCDRDIGHGLEQDYLFPFTHQDRPVRTGIKYFRGKRTDGNDVYDPDLAFRRCDAHADHFVHRCQERVEDLYARLEKKPVIVAMFDTEHFGHWWSEGPTWLNLMIRKLVYDQKTVKLIAGFDYLRKHSTNQVVTPSMSSWGYQGYSETWLMGRNHWIYPELYEAVERLEALKETKHIPETALRLGLNQYLRELLLAQSSDFAYMMWRQTAQQYAEKRVKDHVENMMSIYRQFNRNDIDVEHLNSVQNRNNIFSNMDLFSIYKKVSQDS